ncbi:MAG: ATP-dependent DNA helicase RecG [Brachymonas sp.]|nr:ATP-dependent DNA helicase RecG [Brachymonas sp.]
MPPSAPATPKKTASAAPRPLSPQQKALRKLGLQQPMDFALHVPLRYEDETRIVKLRDARPGEVVQVEGVVTSCEVTFRPRRQLVVTVDDGSDVVAARFFNFYPSQQKALAEGNRVILRGEVKPGFMGATMLHPSFRAAGGELPEVLTPVYPSSGNLPQAYLRRAVVNGLQQAQSAGLLGETIAPEALQDLQQHLRQPPWPLQQALHYLHHPTPDASIAALEDRSHPAWLRLKAEELLAQQLSQAQAHLEREKLQAPALRARTGGLHEKLLAALPFPLTNAQRRVAEEIAHDLQASTPMHRLLQGDVGSGKTVVAALAAAICIDAGWQCVLMAPTEILAEQHFRKLLDWLTPLEVGVAWLTGSQKTKERREMLARIASGEAQLVVGTHAVIQDKVEFHRLALAIIDEQHRFGVQQRLALRQKMQQGRPDVQTRNRASPSVQVAAMASGNLPLALTPALSQGEREEAPCAPDSVSSPIADPVSPPLPQAGEGRGEGDMASVADVPLTPALSPKGRGCNTVREPHLLMMSATPIPRTLAMSYYADLHVSTIDELPPGRTPVLTKLISQQRRDEVVARIGKQIADGRQVYWVCPLIEESEAVDLQNATQTWQDLNADLQGVRTPTGAPVQVALLHARLPVAEKKAVMEAFVNNETQVLVSTTVIEVGVDVPNASLMVIEHAERFGLSQLHQLRGRVGRGSAASTCVLLYAANESGRVGDTAKERLRAMIETTDGFEIAQRDLEIRGPGELLGARQSGAPLLRFADLNADAELVAWARRWAPVMLRQHPLQAARHLERWLGGKADFLKA